MRNVLDIDKTKNIIRSIAQKVNKLNEYNKLGHIIGYLLIIINYC